MQVCVFIRPLNRNDTMCSLLNQTLYAIGSRLNSIPQAGCGKYIICAINTCFFNNRVHCVSLLHQWVIELTYQMQTSLK